MSNPPPPSRASTLTNISLLYSSMRDNVIDTEIKNTRVPRTREVILDAGKETSGKRARSVSSLSTGSPMEVTVNTVQNILNKRQLQVK